MGLDIDHFRSWIGRSNVAHDTVGVLIQSESGFLSVTCSPEEPAKASRSIADIAGGMDAYPGLQNERGWITFCKHKLGLKTWLAQETTRYAFVIKAAGQFAD